MFRDDHPIAWSYHRNTSRWPFNMHGLERPSYEVAPFREDLEAETVALPRPELPEAGLGELLRRRLSCRRFVEEPISLGRLGSLLYAGYGVLGAVELQGQMLERTVPSGGGLYPLELFVLSQRVAGLDGGAYHYLPLQHGLEVVHPHRLPRLLTAEMFLGQPYLVEAAAIVVIAAVVERSLWKYQDRGYRYILLEAGHVAQNLNLCAEALELGSLNLGGFFDQDVQGLLRLDADTEIALYAVAVGKPATRDRTEARLPRSEAGELRRY